MFPGDLTSGKVNSLAHDGTYIYYGGDFTTSNGNKNLQRSDMFAPDTTWNFSNTLTHPVESIAITFNKLFVSSQTPSKYFFGLDLGLNDTAQIQISPTITSAPSKVLASNGTTATLEGGVLNFRILDTLSAGAIPFTSLASQVNIVSDDTHYLTLASPDKIEMRNPFGILDYDLQVDAFDPSSTEVLINSNSTCLFTASGQLRCYDIGTGFRILNKTYRPDNFYFKKGIENFYIFAGSNGAPVVLVP